MAFKRGKKSFWMDNWGSELVDSDKFWDLAEQVLLSSDASKKVVEADMKAENKEHDKAINEFVNSVSIYSVPAPEAEWAKYDIETTPIQTNRSKVQIPTALEMTKVSEKALKELIIEAIKGAASQGERSLIWTNRIPSEAFQEDLRKVGYFVKEETDRLNISW